MSESPAFEREPEAKKAIEPQNVPELQHVIQTPEIKKRVPPSVVDDALREIRREDGPPRQPAYNPRRPFEIVPNNPDAPPSEPTKH